MGGRVTVRDVLFDAEHLEAVRANSQCRCRGDRGLASARRAAGSSSRTRSRSTTRWRAATSGCPGCPCSICSAPPDSAGSLEAGPGVFIPRPNGLHHQADRQSRALQVRRSHRSRNPAPERRHRDLAGHGGRRQPVFAAEAAGATTPSLDTVDLSGALEDRLAERGSRVEILHQECHHGGRSRSSAGAARRPGGGDRGQSAVRPERDDSWGQPEVRDHEPRMALYGGDDGNGGCHPWRPAHRGHPAAARRAAGDRARRRPGRQPDRPACRVAKSAPATSATTPAQPFDPSLHVVW